MYIYLLHFLVFNIKIRPKCTVALMWFHSFFSRKKSEIWIAFTFFEKWKVKSFSFSLFSRNEKWIDFLFHSFREVKVKLKSLEIEIERWNMKKILEKWDSCRLLPYMFFYDHHIRFTQSEMHFNVLSVSSILYLTRLKSEKKTSADLLLERPRTS